MKKHTIQLKNTIEDLIDGVREITKVSLKAIQAIQREAEKRRRKISIAPVKRKRGGI